MSDQTCVHGTAAVMAIVLLLHVMTKKFDPFAPIWLFFVGYVQLYVIQAVMLRDWALGIRGLEVVTTANGRALWALLLFVVVYHWGPGRAIAVRLPAAPQGWSVGVVAAISPFLVAWGLYCAWVVINQGWGTDSSGVSAEETLFRSFPFLLFVAANLLIISARSGPAQRPVMLALGAWFASLYVVIWMFNGKRSHSLIGVLSAVCAYYITRRKRPSWAVLGTTAFVGALVVALSIGWRNNYRYERSVSGFVQYLGDFQFSSILKSLNIEDENDEENDPTKPKSYETLEYGGFLLMLDTVPEKSDYDYGASYIRCVSTFIPRIVWPDKPIFGRDKWVSAWMAGSELPRTDEFTGPAIGVLGAAQLNGGAIATLLVMAGLAILLRAGYEYFLLYDTFPWVQAWWSLTYFNAWFMVVADDPMNWFYYNWGITCLPVLAFLWFANRLLAAAARSARAPFLA
jgi:hypothetical protein